MTFPEFSFTASAPAASGVWPEWARDAGLSALADHVIVSHHAFLRCELPRLHRLLLTLEAGGGALEELRRVFGIFRGELEMHLDKEEDFVFPLCRRLENAGRDERSELAALLPSIGEMELEHYFACRALNRLRFLTDRLDALEALRAGERWEAWLGALTELETDTFQHIRKENELLFPLALERERQFQSRLDIEEKEAAP
jgi:regulator of cell morphogenesis and NO signaling